MGDLEEALRPAEVLQAMVAEVAKRGRRGKAAIDALGGRARQQDLAAVTDRHDPGRPVHGGPEVVPTARLGLAGVDPHPDADRARARPRLLEECPLGGDRGGHGTDRRVEDGHQTVAGGLDDLTVRVGDGRPEQDLVSREGVLHLTRVLLPETRAALDVGEQEGQRRVEPRGWSSVSRPPAPGSFLSVMRPLPLHRSARRDEMIVTRGAPTRRNRRRKQLERFRLGANLRI